MENQLVVANEVELEHLKLRYDPLNIIDLSHQYAVRDKHRKCRIRTFKDGRTAFVREDDEVGESHG